MLRRSTAVVLLFLGASQAAGALDQRCGGAFDWLLCINPSLSYSPTSPPPSSPSPLAGSRGGSDNPAAEKPNVPAGSPLAASQSRPRAPLSLDYRVLNRASKTGAQAAKRPEGQEKTMSKNEKEELYREFLAWQRRQVILDMRNQAVR